MQATRPARVYVDFLQNILGKTLATAYSARASEYAGVSTPLTWKEVDEGVRREDFTMKTVPARLAKVGDLWAALRKSKGIDLSKVVSLRERGLPTSFLPGVLISRGENGVQAILGPAAHRGARCGTSSPPRVDRQRTRHYSWRAARPAAAMGDRRRLRQADFRIAGLYYNSVFNTGSGSGWDTDYPAADNNFSVRLAELTRVPVRLGSDRQPRNVVIRLDDPCSSIARCCSSKIRAVPSSPARKCCGSANIC